MTTPITQSQHFDVLIVGAGPAGCSAALTLLNQSELRVGLVESSNLQRQGIGESVSSSLLALLDHLQVPRSALTSSSGTGTDIGTGTKNNPLFIPTHGSTAFWGSDHATGRDSIFSPDASTYQLDREEFDLVLLTEVMEKGAEIYPRTKLRLPQFTDDQQWQCELQHEEYGEFQLTADFLIDASGRNSTLTSKLNGQRQSLDKLTGVGAFLTRNSELSWPSEQIIESNEFGWWYAAALPNHRVVVTFFSDADILSSHRLNRPAQWRALLNESSHLSKILGVHVPQDVSLWVRKANTSVTNTSHIPQFFAVGDAACSFDPISSMGLGFAMTSASHAAGLICRYHNNADQQQEQQSHKQMLTSVFTTYQQDIQSNFDNYLGLRAHFYQQEQRWADSPFWQRRQASANQTAHLAKGETTQGSALSA